MTAGQIRRRRNVRTILWSVFGALAISALLILLSDPPASASHWECWNPGNCYQPAHPPPATRPTVPIGTTRPNTTRPATTRPVATTADRLSYDPPPPTTRPPRPRPTVPIGTTRPNTTRPNTTRPVATTADRLSYDPPPPTTRPPRPRPTVPIGTTRPNTTRPNTTRPVATTADRLSYDPPPPTTRPPTTSSTTSTTLRDCDDGLHAGSCQWDPGDFDGHVPPFDPPDDGTTLIFSIEPGRCGEEGDGNLEGQECGEYEDVQTHAQCHVSDPECGVTPELEMYTIWAFIDIAPVQNTAPVPESGNDDPPPDCPEGQTRVGTVCVDDPPPPCPEGQTRVGTVCVDDPPPDCPEGQTRVGTVCVDDPPPDCPEGQTRVGTVCVDDPPPDCPEGQTRVGTVCVDDPPPPCPEGQTRVGTVCVDDPPPEDPADQCGEGWYWDGFVCQEYDGEEVEDPDTSVDPCPSGTHRHGAGGSATPTM